MNEQGNSIYQFGAFRLDAREGLLLHGGQTVPLPQKAIETLLALIERKGHVVSKDELMRRVWPDTFVEENNLTQYIFLLRRTLSEGANRSGPIETVPKRGYRFVADVRVLHDRDAEVIVTERTRARLVIRDEIEESDEDNSMFSSAPEERDVYSHSQPIHHPAPEERNVSISGPINRASSRSYGASEKISHQVYKHSVPTGLVGWLQERLRLNSAIVTLAAVVALIAIAGVAYIFASRHAATTAASRPQVHSIAVLPFKSLGAESKDDYLGLSMADALITKLGKIQQLSVRPTSAIQKYEADAREPAQIGRELGVDAVMEGRFQRSGDQIRITAQLVNVKDGTLLWTGQSDELLTNLLAVQDSISEQAAQAMKLQLPAGERERMAKPSTTNPEAYQAYLKGRYFWNRRTPQDMREATKSFEQAIRIDPNYAQAYAGLADSYLLGGNEDQAEYSAKDLARKAIALDHTLAEAHTSLAYYLSALDWNWPEAETEFRRAIELNPNYATAHHWYAYHLASTGRWSGVMTEIRRARELDPASLVINTDIGHMLYLLHGYTQAISQCQKVLEIDPNFAAAHYRMAEAYAQKDMFDAAIAESEKASALGTNTKDLIGYVYAASGQREKARQVIHELKEEARRGEFTEIGIAQTYAALGEKDEAFRWLNEAYRRRVGGLALLKVEPRFESLHSDPRFADLLKKMNLTP